MSTPFRSIRENGRPFELYVLAKGIISDSQKSGLLLHTADLEVQDVYFTLVPDCENVDYPTTLKILDDYFISKANVPFERHLFRQITQSSEEIYKWWQWEGTLIGNRSIMSLIKG